MNVSMISLLCLLFAAVWMPSVHSEDLYLSASDYQAVKEKLEPLGWRVEEADDGAINLWPPIKSEKPVSQNKDVEKSDGAISNFDEFKSILKGKGWDVRKGSDGSMLLYPNQNTNEISEESVASIQVDAGDIPTLKQALSKAGWKIDKMSDGSLIFSRSEIKDDDGAVVPIKTENDVYTTVQHWITKNKKEALVVGKIRKVNWVYIVSLVQDTPPYRLKHQVAVRQHDSKVIELY